MSDKRGLTVIPLTSMLASVALALALAAALVVALRDPGTPARRLSNLDLGETGFLETYLMLSKSDTSRGYVANRRDSTIRRGDRKQPGEKWSVERIHDARLGDAPSIWLIQSKRRGKGTVFFVPVEAVADWTYPFLYDFVRERRPQLKLPEVAWTQLFRNRIYEGLYLRVPLPFDLRKKDGGSGVLRQLLTIRGDRLYKIDSRFDDASGLYVDSVATGVFPELTPPPPALAWLARRGPVEGITFLMSNVEPHRLSLLPLPVSLPRLFEAKNGRAPASFSDSRYQRWSQGPWRLETDASPPFSESELEELGAEFRSYAESLHEALRIHAEYYRRPELLREHPSLRQAAISDLRLDLDEL